MGISLGGSFRLPLPIPSAKIRSLQTSRISLGIESDVLEGTGEAEGDGDIAPTIF